MSNILFTGIDKDTTLGIDTSSVNVPKDQPFRGFHSIPHINNDDVHVIHFQHDSGGSGESHATGVRYGYWFAKGNYYVVYDDTLEIYLMREERDEQRYQAALSDAVSRGLVSEFPRIDEGNVWGQLSSEITWPMIESITPQSEDMKCDGTYAYVETSLVTAEESALLQKTLDVGNSTQPGSYENNAAEGSFSYTPIKFMSRAAIRPGHEMQDFHDKSFYLNDVILPQYMHNQWSRYIGELQYSFLNMLLLGNYGSSLQWHAMIDLVCRSSAVSTTRMAQLDTLVHAQIEILPQEYRDTLLSETMWQEAMGESLQHNNMPLTKSALQASGLLPRETDAGTADTVEWDSDGEGARYLNIEGSDSDADDGPVVVSRVTYR